MNRVQDKLIGMYKWVVTRDYSNPPVLLTAVAVVLLPFVAKYYVMTGLLLGLIHAVGLLWLIEKMPNKFKKTLQKYPVASDLSLSFGAVYLVGSMFGEGLTLGLGALFCTVIMSLALPNIKMKDEPEYNEIDGEAAATPGVA